MRDEFSLCQDDGLASEAVSGGDAARELLPASGDFELPLQQAPGVPVDADADGMPDGLAFDLDQDGVANAIELDTDGDGMGDTGLFDLDQDGVADVVTMDTDGDGAADSGFVLEQAAPEPFVDVPEEDGAIAGLLHMDADAAAAAAIDAELVREDHSLTALPDDITQSDVEGAVQDLSTQSHIQSGMNDMYEAIYHEPVDPF